jgi:hypothetical protein
MCRDTKEECRGCRYRPSTGFVTEGHPASRSLALCVLLATPDFLGFVHELQGGAVVAQLKATADGPCPSLPDVPGWLGVELVGYRFDGSVFGSSVLPPRIAQLRIDAPDGMPGIGIARVNVVGKDRDLGAVDPALEDVGIAKLTAAVATLRDELVCLDRTSCLAKSRRCRTSSRVPVTQASESRAVPTRERQQQQRASRRQQWQFSSTPHKKRPTIQ